LKIELNEDQKLLVQLALEKANGYSAEASKLEAEARKLRLAGDSLIAESVARIATRNGMKLPENSKSNIKFVAGPDNTAQSIEVEEEKAEAPKSAQE